MSIFFSILSKMRTRVSIPSIMYHHVSNHPEDSLNISPERFDGQIKYLKDSGYVSLTLAEMFDALFGKRSSPEKSVLITIDDGYLDNWVYAFPILKKYGMKATIFAITNLIKDSLPYRPNFEDVWSKKYTSQDLPAIAPHREIARRNISAKGGLPDYMTWEEMRTVEKSGLIEIQSHTHTHAACFEGDKIISFSDGSSIKLGWSTDGDFRLGIPIYKMAPALVTRRYFDDKSLRDWLAKYVEVHGGEDFLKMETWKQIVMSEAKKYIKENGGLKGHFETKEEQIRRIKNELSISKKIIEEKLDKKCDYVCWPWGSTEKELEGLAREAGYKGGVGMKRGANTSGTNPMNTHRFNGCQKDMASFVQKLNK